MSKSIHCHPTQTKLKQALSLDTLTLGCPGCLKVISLTSRLEKTIMVIVLCFDDAIPYRKGAMPNSRQVNEWMLICKFSYLIVTRQAETAMVECSTKRCGKLRAPGGGCLWQGEVNTNEQDSGPRLEPGLTPGRRRNSMLTVLLRLKCQKGQKIKKYSQQKVSTYNISLLECHWSYYRA